MKVLIERSDGEVLQAVLRKANTCAQQGSDATLLIALLACSATVLPSLKSPCLGRWGHARLLARLYLCACFRHTRSKLISVASMFIGCAC